jgi:sulfatase modifying factor 1
LYLFDVKSRGFVAMLALSSSVAGWACGAATGVGLFDVAGVDGGVEDNTISDDSGCDPASCAPGGPGMMNCGASSECCCTSMKVTAGKYFRTYANDGGGPTEEADPAAVSSFRLDKYLVTVGRFRQFVAAWSAGYYPPNGSGKHTHLNGGLGLAVAPNVDAGQTYEPGRDATDWNNVNDIDPTTENLQSGSPYSTWTPTATTNENLPINTVTWWEAYAFCIWDGGFRPSEAEWEYAAAGGSQQLEYPWGSTAPGTACPGTGCEYAIYDCQYPSGSGSCTGVTNIAPVGYASLGAVTWGQFDLAGEVYQWNLDWYANSGLYQDPCTDCAYLTTASDRVIRGDNFNVFLTAALCLLPPSRNGFFPTSRFSIIGFRCARTP